MDRLTFDGNFCDIACCSEHRGGEHCPDGYCAQRRVWERLKEYEDAEQAERIAVLPCKIGDTVYIFDYASIPVPSRVQGMSITYSAKTILHFGGYPIKNAWGDEMGKTIFLTRKEAEAALEAQKCGDEG